MTRSPKLALYAGLACVSFVTALVLGRPELAALGAPFALVLAAGVVLPPPAELAVQLHLRDDQAIEGQELEAELVLSASRLAHGLQLALDLPDGVRIAGGSTRLVLELDPNERVLPLRLVCERWGAHRLGAHLVRSSDRAGLRILDRRGAADSLLRVYPRPEHLRSLVRPLETQPYAGNRVARAKGEGIEFADVRPYAPGDRARRINWRASALRQSLYVNEQHPERNSDVVLFLDSFVEARRLGETTLDLAIRAAVALAEHYLVERDRVGLVSFGGIVRWLAPAGGELQRYRIVEALLATEVTFSYAWKDINVVPARSLTPQALVLAISPLLDERFGKALLDLRGRGFDLVVVDVSPVELAGEPRDPSLRLALRLWRLWRDALRFRYEQAGIAAVEWDGGTPLAAAIEEVRTFRRFARYASV
jgi:uncharacterized protein (DUF58 family)